MCVWSPRVWAGRGEDYSRDGKARQWGSPLSARRLPRAETPLRHRAPSAPAMDLQAKQQQAAQKLMAAADRPQETTDYRGNMGCSLLYGVVFFLGSILS